MVAAGLLLGESEEGAEVLLVAMVVVDGWLEELVLVESVAMGRLHHRWRRRGPYCTRLP